MSRLFCLLVLAAAFCAGAAKVETFTVATSAPNNRRLEFAVRLPERITPQSRIMVLFGGRNWKAAQTLKAYRFDRLADRYGLVLLAPSFFNDDYWEPEKWSGRALFEAVARVEKKYGVPQKQMLYFGYSAGGQCANLFYNYAPHCVGVWGAHGCGVYFSFKGNKFTRPAPALLSCGLGDDIRFEISRTFAFNYREKGGRLLWLTLPGGHELNPKVLEVARTFFAEWLDRVPPSFVADDESGIVYPVSQAESIDPEYRNYLSEKIKGLIRP